MCLCLPGPRESKTGLHPAAGSPKPRLSNPPVGFRASAAGETGRRAALAITRRAGHRSPSEGNGPFRPRGRGRPRGVSADVIHGKQLTVSSGQSQERFSSSSDNGPNSGSRLLYGIRPPRYIGGTKSHPGGGRRILAAWAIKRSRMAHGTDRPERRCDGSLRC